MGLGSGHTVEKKRNMKRLANDNIVTAVLELLDSDSRPDV